MLPMSVQVGAVMDLYQAGNWRSGQIVTKFYWLFVREKKAAGNLIRYGVTSVQLRTAAKTFNEVIPYLEK